MWSRFHIWIGILAAIPWALQAVTGALLVFEPQLDAAMNPSLFHVQPAETRLDLDQQFAVVKRERPELAASIYAIELAAPPGRATMMLAKPNKEVGPKDGVRVFIDPYRGTLLGTQNYRDSLMGKVYHFHRTFYVTPWGKWLTSTSAILLMASTATGFVLFFARRVRRRTAGSVAGDALYRWHNRLGVCTAPLIFLIAFNGAFVTYRFAMLPLIYSLTGSPVPRSMLGKTVAVDVPADPTRISLERAMQIARDAVPNATDGVLLSPVDTKRPITVVRRKPNEPRDIGGTFVNINPYTGEVVYTTDFTDGSLGDRLTYLSIHLHSGQAGGYFGESGKYVTQILWILTALCVPLLAVLGIASRWKRRRPEQPSTAADTIPTGQE